MTDEEFLVAFERCTLPGEAFRHRDHLRLAWVYLRRCSQAQAAISIESGIRRFATYHGAPHKYHHTLTLVWIRLVASAEVNDRNVEFEAFLTAHPQLLDQDSPRRFYSPERLMSPAARNGWVEPDLYPLPEVDPHA